MADTYFGQSVELWEDLEDSSLRTGLAETDTDGLCTLASTGWYRNGAASAAFSNTGRTAVSYIGYSATASSFRFAFWYHSLNLGTGSWIDNRSFLIIGGNDDANTVVIKDNYAGGERKFECTIGGSAQTSLIVTSSTDYFITIQYVDQTSCNIRVYSSSGSLLTTWSGTLPGWATTSFVRVGQMHTAASTGEICYVDDIIYDNSLGSGYIIGWSTGYTLTADAASYSFTGQDATIGISGNLSADAGSYTFTGADATLTHTAVSTGNIIDHTNYDPSGYSNAEITAGGALDVYLEHASVGGNILDGLDALYTENNRYTHDHIGWSIYSGDGLAHPDWFDTHNGFGTYNRNNPDAAIKISDFVTRMASTYSHVDVAMFKFCFIDDPSDGDALYDSVISAIESLEASYPSVIFPLWTMPITTTTGSAQRQIYNDSIRSYCETNNHWLFDIADLESHDDSGNAQLDGNNREILYSGYASDSGHLNAAGGLKMAKALWSMWTQIAGAASGYTLPADAGSFSESGTSADTLYSRVLPADPGSYSESAFDVDFYSGRLVAADSVSYSETAADADLIYTPLHTAYTLVADGAAYTETTGATDLLGAFVLDAYGEYYFETGDSASLEYSPHLAFSIVADPGIYAETASDAELVHNNLILLKYIDIPVYRSVDSVPRYWGPLSSPPSTAFIIYDYYFDDRASGSGGGVIRYYDGDSWEEMLSSNPLYIEANWNALADMGEWATDQGSVIAAASAIFSKLVTADAFIANLFAQQITVPTGGHIQYETGSGIQKRCVRLSDDCVDWVDIPDTSPASDEVLRARIGRLGVGSQVLLQGDFENPIISPYTSAAITISSSAEHGCYLPQADGSLKFLYRESTNGYINQRTLSGSSWGSAATVTSASRYFPSCIQTTDGALHLMCIDSSGNMYEKTNSSGTWSSETTVATGVKLDFISYCIGSDDTLYIYYIRSSDDYLIRRGYSSGAWGSAETVRSSATSGAKVVLRRNGDLWVFYYVSINASSGYIYYTIYSNGSWNTPASITTCYPCSFSVYETLDENIHLLYAHVTSPYHLYERIYSSSTWSSAVLAVDEYSTIIMFVQEFSGRTRIARVSSSTIYEHICYPYSQSGAGVIAYGGTSTDGYWRKWSNGDIECWNEVTPSTSPQTVNFPTDSRFWFYAAPNISLTAMTAAAYISTAPSTTSFAVAGSSGYKIWWKAFGRWRS